LTEAEAFLNMPAANGSASSPSSTTSTTSKASKPSKPSTILQKFYAVQNGRVPGVYTDWSSAQKQITGWTKPKHKSFATRSEAEAFVKAGVADGQAIAGVHIEPDGLSPQVAANMNGSKISEPPAKKRKKSAELPFTEAVEDGDEWYEAGMGPLPFGAEDGFDPRIILDPATGMVVYKNKEQMDAQKMIPTGETRAGETLKIWTDGSSLGNGKQGAVAGVGVWFGPSDNR